MFLSLGIQAGAYDLEDFTIAFAVSLGFAGAFGSVCFLRILAGLPDERTQALQVGVGVQGQPVLQGLVVGNQPVTPLLGVVESQGVGCAALMLHFQGGFNGRHRFILQLAHQFANELHLPASAFEVGDASGFGQCVDQFVRQVELVHQPLPQGEQVLAEPLQSVALFLQIGLADFDIALEFAFELKVQFAAFRNEMAFDEVAFGGFSCHPSIIAASMKKTRSPAPRTTAAQARSFPAPEAGFQYHPEQFEALADLALTHARQLGASDAGVEVSEGAGLSVSVRKGELENVERNRDKSLGVTVYLGQRRGNASTSDFGPDAIRQTVQAAYDIARFTAEDPVAGLPDEQDVANSYPDLDLFHPWAISAEEAVALAMRCEAAAMATSRKITNSEGAGVSAQQSHFFTEHMRGGERGRQGIFRGGYASSRHSLSVSPIAGKGAQMQRDYWFSSMRDPADLASPEAVGRYAAERALSRLNARKLPTTECPVLFEAPAAAGLLGAFVQAISGGALYRKTSFLVDSLGRQVFPRHIDLFEDPLILGGKGSAPFDDEGVKTVARQVVSAGCVKGYFLSTYSARKLGMRTTGNAGGSHNLYLRSRETRESDDLVAMLQKLGTGLFVTELMGQGVNYVTGDYSRGAAGFWVENGEIAFPVQEITIAGNLKDMFLDVAAVGADEYAYGAKHVGSVLISRMKVAGS